MHQPYSGLGFRFVGPSILWLRSCLDESAATKRTLDFLIRCNGQWFVAENALMLLS